MRTPFDKSNLIAAGLSLICLLFESASGFGEARDFIYLIPYGWLANFIPLICACVQFFAIRAIYRRWPTSFHTQKQKRVVNMQNILVMSVILLTLAPLATVQLLNATLLDSVEVPKQGLDDDQLSHLEGTVERRLDFKVVCYWEQHTIHIVFRKQEGRSQIVRDTITAELNAFENPT